MALSGGVQIANCRKKYTTMLVLQNESYGSVKMRRGDSAGTGKFVCPDAPKKKGQKISTEWHEPYIDLKIKVEKKLEEVEDPRDGISVICQEFDCPFNTGKER